MKKGILEIGIIGVVLSSFLSVGFPLAYIQVFRYFYPFLQRLEKQTEFALTVLLLALLYASVLGVVFGFILLNKTSLFAPVLGTGISAVALLYIMFGKSSIFVWRLDICILLAGISLFSYLFILVVLLVKRKNG